MDSDLTNSLAIWAVLVLPVLVIWNVIDQRNGRVREEEAKLMAWLFMISFGCITSGGSMLETGGWAGFLGLALLGIAGYFTYFLIRIRLED